MVPLSTWVHWAKTKAQNEHLDEQFPPK